MDICWNSLIQQRYFDGINESLAILKRIIDEVIDLKEQRIDTLLNKIASHELINLPGDKSIKVRSRSSSLHFRFSSGSSIMLRLIFRLQSLLISSNSRLLLEQNCLRRTRNQLKMQFMILSRSLYPMKTQPMFHQTLALIFVKHLLLPQLLRIQMLQIWMKKRKNLFSNRIVER